MTGLYCTQKESNVCRKNKRLCWFSIVHNLPIRFISSASAIFETQQNQQRCVLIPLTLKSIKIALRRLTTRETQKHARHMGRESVKFYSIAGTLRAKRRTFLMNKEKVDNLKINCFTFSSAEANNCLTLSLNHSTTGSGSIARKSMLAVIEIFQLCIVI